MSPVTMGSRLLVETGFRFIGCYSSVTETEVVPSSSGVNCTLMGFVPGTGPFDNIPPVLPLAKFPRVDGNSQLPSPERKGTLPLSGMTGVGE